MRPFDAFGGKEFLLILVKRQNLQSFLRSSLFKENYYCFFVVVALALLVGGSLTHCHEYLSMS